MLTMPPPLNPRLFHSAATLADYNAAVASYLAQQAQANHTHSKSPKRKHASRKEQYDNQH